MTSALVTLIVLLLLFVAAAACVLTPLVAFALILWSWRTRATGERQPRASS